MIKFDNVSMSYPQGLEALINVSFEINKGEMVFLTGHSGAGKSTFLKLITLMWLFFDLKHITQYLAIIQNNAE